MIAPTPAELAAMAAVECPEDGGDGSPFGWIDGSELTPEGASGGASSRLSAPRGVAESATAPGTPLGADLPASELT